MIKTNVKEIIKSDHVTYQYPYIGVLKAPNSDTQLFVLFTQKGTGVVIAGNSNLWQVGHYSSDWVEEEFDWMRDTIQVEFSNFT